MAPTPWRSGAVAGAWRPVGAPWLLGACLLATVPAWSAPPEGAPPPDAAQEAVDGPPAVPAAPVVVPPQVVEEPQAVYPPEAFEAGVEAMVILVLDIDAEGLVTQVEVREAAGQGFDEAATAAMAAARFTPATVDGVPTPVRVSYNYRFTIRQEITVKEVQVDYEELPVIIRGFVRERGTRKKLDGALIFVVETDVQEVSGAGGAFEIRGVGAGTYTLEVPLEGYLPFDQEVVVEEGEVTEVELKLTRDVFANFRTVVKRERVEKNVSKTTLQVEEIQKVPGAGGDGFKVIETLPGVARSSFGSGQLIVRGSAPEDTRTYVDGQQISQLYHFGGLYSTINTDLLEALDFYPGGYSARYGYATGGLLEARFRKPRNDAWHGTLDVNFIQAGFLVEGPTSDNTSLALAFRRSYIDAILPAVLPPGTLDFVVAPKYYDYQLLFDADLGGGHNLNIAFYGANDRLSFVLDEPSGPGGAFRGNFYAGFMFHTLDTRWNWAIEKGLNLATSLKLGYQTIDFSLGEAGFFNLEIFPVVLRTELTWEMEKNYTLLAGVEWRTVPVNIALFLPPPPSEGQIDDPPTLDDYISQELEGITTYYLSPYLEATIRLADQLTLVPGLRFDLVRLRGSGYESLDPRLAVRWDAHERLTLKLFAGLYHQPPQPVEWDEVAGNPELGPERAYQVSLGAEVQITDDLSLDIQGFYKWLDNLVVPAPPLSGVGYTGDGVGRVYGGELLLKHAMSRWFFGWLSYSLIVAERQDTPGGAWRPFDFDQTHILNAVGVFRLLWGIEFGFRFRLASGNPDTPVMGATYNVDTDGYTPIYGPVNSDRNALFHQLDLRIDKKFIFDDWMLDLYIEVQNVYMQPNQEGTSYNYDFTEKRPISGIPIIPSFGIKGQF